MNSEITRSQWTDHAWEIIDTGPQSPQRHMALDALLLDEVNAGKRAPTLRFWEWASPAVVIGTFQSVRNEVDMEAANAAGVQVVRVSTGGVTMLDEQSYYILY